MATSKNLTESNLFALGLFIEGEPKPDSWTHPFNITSGKTQVSSSVVGAPPLTSTALSGTPISNTVSTTASTVAVSNTSSPSEAPSGGLNTAAQIGIGIGVSVPCAIILTVFASWFFLARRRREGNTTAIFQPTTVNEVSTHPSLVASQHRMGLDSDKNGRHWPPKPITAPGSVYELYDPSGEYRQGHGHYMP